jgi:hypothetical protein
LFAGKQLTFPLELSFIRLQFEKKPFNSNNLEFFTPTKRNLLQNRFLKGINANVMPFSARLIIFESDERNLPFGAV